MPSDSRSNDADAWTPIPLDELKQIVDKQLATCDRNERALFEAHRVPPFQIPIRRFGRIEDVFAVARFGARVLYYEDVEEGFELSTPDEHGTIPEQGCNQFELPMVLKQLLDGDDNGTWVDGTYTLRKESAERLTSEISESLARQGQRSEPFAKVVVDEWKPSMYRVFYRNAGEGLNWELTATTRELAVTAIKRWDSSSYRELRPIFDALLAGAPEVIWLEPQLDRVEVVGSPEGIFSIDVDELGCFRLLWRAQGSEVPVDLSRYSPEEAVSMLFGADGVSAYRTLYGED